MLHGAQASGRSRDVGDVPVMSGRNLITSEINPSEIEFAELCDLSFMRITAKSLQD